MQISPSALYQVPSSMAGSGDVGFLALMEAKRGKCGNQATANTEGASPTRPTRA